MACWSELGREKHLAPGEYLWSQGDLAGRGAFLKSGVLGVEKVSLSGDRVVFTELGEGVVLGEMSLLDGAPHSATVKALTDCKIQLFTSEAFHAFLERHPAELRRLLQKQNERLRFLTEKLLQVGTQPVHQRLAYWLLERGEGKLQTTHHELAAHLATTRESVSKALGQLRKVGAVRSGRGYIEVLDKLTLAESVEGL